MEDKTCRPISEGAYTKLMESIEKVGALAEQAFAETRRLNERIDELSEIISNGIAVEVKTKVPETRFHPPRFLLTDIKRKIEIISSQKPICVPFCNMAEYLDDVGFDKESIGQIEFLCSLGIFKNEGFPSGSVVVIDMVNQDGSAALIHYATRRELFPDEKADSTDPVDLPLVIGMYSILEWTEDWEWFAWEDDEK